MKADASSWLGGVGANAGAGSAGANGPRTAEPSAKKPAFDQLLRRDAPGARAESAAPAGKRQRDAAPAREPARDARTDDSARAQADEANASADDAASASASAATAQAERDTRKDRHESADEDAAWPPAGLILAVFPPPLDSLAGTPESVPPGIPGHGTSALSTGFPAGLRLAANAMPMAGTMLAEGGLATPATSTEAAPADPLAFAGAMANAARPADAPPASASTGTTPSAIPIGDLAAGETTPLSATLAAGLAALKDMAGDGGGADTDAPAPIAAPLAGMPAPASDYGLARTATVNPLASMTPDLRGDRFGDTLGTQMTWMAEQKIGHAHIRVSPGDLGAIEVSLRLDGDRVHADFSSAQPEVRQALQDSLPRLREMLGQQGFQLAQADVGHRQQPQSPPTQTTASRGGGDGTASTTDTAPRSAPVRIARGLLDAYA